MEPVTSVNGLTFTASPVYRTYYTTDSSATHHPYTWYAGMDPSTNPPKLVIDYKEPEMEIGGDKCHLCGQDKMYLCTEMRVSPKHIHRTCHITYQCGTEIMRSWRDDECGVKDRWQQNIHVGSDCIEVES